MPDDKLSRLSRWIGPVVTLGVIVLIIALLLPAVQQAREAARRTQAKNNLKQIGLALHNYHDVFQMFPPGGVFNEKGTAFHGWTTYLAPYLDCSPFYNSLNFQIPWDDPQQVERFITMPHPAFLNPSQQPEKSPDGIPLVHFSANQWLLHRNSSTTIKNLETGTSNTLAMGNSFGNFDPLGYPYIWRDPLIPINTSPDGFGYNNLGLSVLLVDGSVRWIAKDMAAEIGESFAGPEKLKPTAEEVAKPAGEYRIGHDFLRSETLFFSEPHYLKLVARINRAGETKGISFEQIPTKDGRQRVTAPFDDQVNLFLSRKSIESIDSHGYFSDAALREFPSLPNLKLLSVGRDWITDQGASHIAAMPALTTLTLDQTEITAKGLAELQRAAKLTKLTIIEPAFGDDGLAVLEQFPSLTEADLIWYIRPVKVTHSAMARLIAVKPELKLQIRYEGRLLNRDGIQLLVSKGLHQASELFRDEPADALLPVNGGE